MLLNSGQSFTTAIPQDGIIVINTSTITQPTDILHVDISGGGTLRGIMLTENGSDLGPNRRRPAGVGHDRAHGSERPRGPAHLLSGLSG
jgi:hypothetical protein